MKLAAAAAAALWIMRMTSLNLARSLRHLEDELIQSGERTIERVKFTVLFPEIGLVPACMVFFITGRKYIRKIPNHWLNPKRSYLIFSADLFFFLEERKEYNTGTEM